MSSRYQVSDCDTHAYVVDVQEGRVISKHDIIREAEAEAARLNVETPKRGERFLPCPFCGKPPKHGPGKKQYCQLHGEPFQHYVVWCEGHARMERPDKADALREWNARVRIEEIEE